LFDIYAYDENGEFVEIAVRDCPAAEFKMRAMRLVCDEGYGAVKVVEQADGVIVYTIG